MFTQVITRKLKADGRMDWRTLNTSSLPCVCVWGGGGGGGGVYKMDIFSY